jgi:hypothetical protein
MNVLNFSTNSSRVVMRKTTSVMNVPRSAGMKPMRKIQRITLVESESTRSTVASRPTPMRNVGQSPLTSSLQRTSLSLPVAWPSVASETAMPKLTVNAE